MEPISSNDTFNDLQRFMESWDEEGAIITGVPAAIELPEFQIHPQASHDLQELNPSSSFSDSLLQTYVDDYQPENCHDPGCAYETVWPESFQETQLSEDSNSFPACKTCMTYSANVSTPCGHVFCLSCLSGYLQDEAKPCPICNTQLSMNAITSNVDIPESNQVAPESMIFQDLTLEYQPVWQAQRGPLHNEAVDAELASCERKRTTFAVDHNGVAMRFDGVEERFTAYYRPSYWTEDDSAVFLGEYPTFEEAKDAHNLVALLHEGPHAQMDLAPFTADKYTEELKRWEGKHHVDLVCELRLRGRGILKDGSVNYKNVGRRLSTKKTGTTRTRYFSTVLLNDSGPSNTVNTAKPKRTFLQTFDLKRMSVTVGTWGTVRKETCTDSQGHWPHIRGRSIHAEIRSSWLAPKREREMMFPVLSATDNPEQAARLADEVLVKQKGVYAWTNFPLTSYITSNDKLPLTFLPLSNNFRENLTHKRARDF